MSGDRGTDKPSLEDTMNTNSKLEDAGEVFLPPATVALGPELQAHIGRQLRAVYDEIAQQPVPDRFLQLLDELERKQAHNS
jgi:hypothetical protein